MQVPTRRSQLLKKQDDGPVYLTKTGVLKLEKTLAYLNKELPRAIEEVERTKEYGDFSENEEYKAAKRKMRGIHSRIASIKSRLARVVLIEEGKNTNTVQLGSTVVLETLKGDQKIYQILGTHESDPVNGRISHESPLGSTLIGKSKGDEVKVEQKSTTMIYRIVKIQ